MQSIINSLLCYTDEDVVFDELIERYRRLCLSRFIFLSLFPLEEKKTYDTIYSNISKQAEKKDILITEQILNLIEDEDYPYRNELKVVSVYLVYGNEVLEEEVCSLSQLKKAKEVALSLVSDRIWELTSV